jgi:Kef-type K+ transport system membrane component KefB
MATHYPVFWLLLAGVAAPLLAQVPVVARMPVVVLEVLLGIALGPQGLGLVHFDGFVATMFAYGMAFTLFVAGTELDFAQIRGRPLNLALGGWALSVVLALAIVAAQYEVPQLHAPMMITLALCTTGLGVLVPIFRDGGLLDTLFGRMVLAAGTVGEVGPIVAMSVLLSTRFSAWQELGYLLLFLAIVGVAIVTGINARPPAIVAFLSRHMRSSSQLPVRLALLLIVGLFALAEGFGFESIFGAFAAGLIVRQAMRGDEGEPMREKLDAVAFGWFYPFFFVGTGVKFDLSALTSSATTALLVPAFVLMFLLVRGAPVLLYRQALAAAQRWPFALSSAVPSLSIVVVITEVGVKAGTMQANIAAAMVGAALLSVLLFPTITAALLQRDAAGAAVRSGALPPV